MRAVKSRDTSLERRVGAALHREGLRYRRCVAGLAGKPDFVFAAARVVVFVDGDFWHGWRFPAWKDSLQPYWQSKIQRNRRRDRLNFRRLRRAGWIVLRIWEHQVDRDLEGVARLVRQTVHARRRSRPVGTTRSEKRGGCGASARQGRNGAGVGRQRRSRPRVKGKGGKPCRSRASRPRPPANAGP